MSPNSIPSKVVVNMYNMGFGDSFLLNFMYPTNVKRSILIDCGSHDKDKDEQEEIVDEIVKDCNHTVDAIIITHRHKDHLSAFGFKGLSDKLLGLNPKLIVMPWTEDPNAEEDAKKPSSIYKDGLNLMQNLRYAEEFADEILKYQSKFLRSLSMTSKKELLNIIGLSTAKNKAALKNLYESPCKHNYVYTGSKSGLDSLLPGISVSVLGPPTLEQSSNIKKQATFDDNEFWKFRMKLSKATISSAPTKGKPSSLFDAKYIDSISRAPSYTKWVIDRADEINGYNVKRIVRILDNAMNNTSVILLFEIKGKKLLFPGDAQLENWQYALSKAEYLDKLRNINLYKVGHHGSGNATPKQGLWDKFKNRGHAIPDSSKIITLLSSLKGVYSRVPAKNLLETMRDESILYTTNEANRISMKNKVSLEIAF